MNKIFEILEKPAKWVLIIGSFVYALWFAIKTAMGIGGGFMPVMCNILILVIGLALLVAVPVLVLLKKDDTAKIIFIFLVGYWVLTTIQEWFFYADTFTDSDNGLHIVSGIFCFILGLALIAILVLNVLDFIFMKPAFRFISLLILLGVIAFALITAILLVIISAQMDAFWPQGMDFLMSFILLPVLICFGYLYFIGAPKQKS